MRRQRLQAFVPSRLTGLWREMCGPKVGGGASWADVQQTRVHIGATLRQSRPRQTAERSGGKEGGGSWMAHLCTREVSMW